MQRELGAARTCFSAASASTPSALPFGTFDIDAEAAPIITSVHRVPQARENANVVMAAR